MWGHAVTFHFEENMKFFVEIYGNASNFQIDQWDCKYFFKKYVETNGIFLVGLRRVNQLQSFMVKEFPY